MPTVSSIYTIIIGCYVYSRFVLAAIYRPPRNAGIEPTVAIVVPAFNENEAVERTIDSCAKTAYPADKLEIVVVNDGSTDNTWQHITRAAARHPSLVTCIDLGRNMGKRAAVTAGIRATEAEIIVSVDSDSIPAPWAIRKLVQGFADHKVGAISGLTYVRNATTNLLTRMQAASYYVNFQLFKAAESVVNTVSCASGCFCAYRRAAVMPVLDDWENQKLFGRPWSHGDDRALTNMILRHWKVIYDSEAEAWTDAPDEYRKFFKQQLRWEKSFVGESLVLVGHTWRSHPIAFPAVLVATVSGIVSPLVMLYQLGWEPITDGTAPVFYLDLPVPTERELRAVLPKPSQRRQLEARDHLRVLLHRLLDADLLGNHPHRRQQLGHAGRRAAGRGTGRGGAVARSATPSKASGAGRGKHTRRGMRLLKFVA